MTTKTDEQERAAFEAWANGRCELHLVNPAGRYSSAITQFAWEAWQARAALQAQDQEDAAQELRRLHESEIQAAALIKEMLQLIEDWERCSEMLSQRIHAASALRAALEEAEAALEVATSRLSARGANYPVHVTSEARALESVRQALGKSQPDHFRDATKMMLPTAPAPQGLDAERLRNLICQMVDQFERRWKRRDGNAPGHGHSIPGVWDSDNGELAGKKCAWCEVWQEALAVHAAAQAKLGRDDYESSPGDMG